MVKQKDILISGGLGFIGLRLAQRLVEEGFHVRLLDNLSPQIHGALPDFAHITILQNRQIDIVRGDVRHRDVWRDVLSGIGCIIHLAAETGTAQSMYEIERYTATNVLGCAALLDVLANETHSVSKIILASSRSVYGEGAYNCSLCGIVYPPARSEGELSRHEWEPKCPMCKGAVQPAPTSEKAETRPASVYAATKLAQEDLVRIAGRALGITTVAFRLQNVYGEGQSLSNPYTGILSIFSNRIRQNIPVYLFEDGQETRDFVHVSDVVEAMALAVLSSDHMEETLNVGCGTSISVERIARLLKQQFGDKSDPIVSAQYRVGDIRHCYADLTRIRELLGFAPRVGIEDGLERFVSWVKTRPVEPDRLDKANQELLERGFMASTVVC